jgi:hypothetical protein
MPFVSPLNVAFEVFEDEFDVDLLLELLVLLSRPRPALLPLPGARVLSRGLSLVVLFALFGVLDDDAEASP